MNLQIVGTQPGSAAFFAQTNAGLSVGSKAIVEMTAGVTQWCPDEHHPERRELWVHFCSSQWTLRKTIRQGGVLIPRAPELRFELMLPPDIPDRGFIGLRSLVVIEKDRMVFARPKVLRIVEVPRDSAHTCPWAHTRERDELLGQLGFPSVHAWLQARGSDIPWN